MGVLERTLGREAAYLPEGGGGVHPAFESCSQAGEQEQGRSFSGIFSAYQKERANKRLKQKPSGCHTRW